MATSNQDTNIKDVAAPASATPTNIGHLLGLNAAKTQDVLIPLSMLRQVIAQELQSALSAITSGSPNVPVLDGGNLKYMTLANFAKVAGGLTSKRSYGTTITIVKPNDTSMPMSLFIEVSAPTVTTAFIYACFRPSAKSWSPIRLSNGGIDVTLQYDSSTGYLYIYRVGVYVRVGSPFGLDNFTTEASSSSLPSGLTDVSV